MVVYFWTASGGQADQDFAILKRLTDRYQERGLEVIFVNLDGNPAQAKAFLAGQLTAGVHLHQPGGLDSSVAERYGLQSLPQAFLLNPDGTLLQRNLQAGQLKAAVANLLPR